MNRDLPALPRSRRRTATQWKAIVNEFHQSGMSAKSFCLDRGVGYASFCQWRKRFADEPVAPRHCDALSTPSFIDLGTIASPACVPPAWRIVLKLGNGVELCLSQDNVSP